MLRRHVSSSLKITEGGEKYSKDYSQERPKGHRREHLHLFDSDHLQAHQFIYASEAVQLRITLHLDCSLVLAYGSVGLELRSFDRPVVAAIEILNEKRDSPWLVIGKFHGLSLCFDEATVAHSLEDW